MLQPTAMSPFYQHTLAPPLQTENEKKETYKFVVSAADSLLGAAVTSETNSSDGAALKADQASYTSKDVNAAEQTEELVDGVGLEKPC